MATVLREEEVGKATTPHTPTQRDHHHHRLATDEPATPDTARAHGIMTFITGGSDWFFSHLVLDY